MLSINTNLSSLITQRSLKQSTNKLNQAIERMTTGAKINHAKDNAANYSISTNMTTKIGSYNVAEDNAAMGLDLIATAEGSLNLIQDKLTRLRSLAVTAQNGTYGDKSLEALETEANSIVSEIKREYANSEYNGIKLFNETATTNPTGETALTTFALARTTSFDHLTRVSETGTLVSGQSYRIDDATDLVALQDYVNGGGDTTNVTFELTDDIDMNGVAFLGIGDTLSFRGVFNGNGHLIKNLEIHHTTSDGGIGLFRSTLGATINQLGVTDCNIGSTSQDCVGALVGLANNTTVLSCFSTGKVVGRECAGGLIGEADRGGKYENCYSNTNVEANQLNAGGLIGFTDCLYSNKIVTIQNCYATGNITSPQFAGGLIGRAEEIVINNSYASGNINSSDKHSGGLTGNADNAQINNCYSSGTVIGNQYTGSFIGYVTSASGTDNYCNIAGSSQSLGRGSFSGVEAKSIDEINIICSHGVMGFTEANGWKIVNGTPRLAWENTDPPPVPPPNTGADGEAGGSIDNTGSLFLQVGTNASSSSNISVDIYFDISGIDAILANGLTDMGCINSIDNMIKTATAKLVEYGAATNRLESVLEEIIISRDNLISSRSTLRDADISEVSSSYIQQQILQQASATLMATANQSASIALSLI